MKQIDWIVASQKKGQPAGIPSVCSAHPAVLEAALRHAKTHILPVLIEATCNQVNQFGGYTGMQPADFVRFVGGLAEKVGFDRSRLLLGGDHLGPLVWSGEPAAGAMQKARELVGAYTRAGFGKIHLDASMPCADDRELSVETIAHRVADLAWAAETACPQAGLPALCYVIGSEVPAAGGTRAGEGDLTVTSPADAAATIELTRRAFAGLGLQAAWERVVGLVVQPGVEFGDAAIHEYDRPAAAALSQMIESVPGIIYEAHSTDYQTRRRLTELVKDHFAILKVGPGLTFAYREAVFAMAEIEAALFEGETSRIRETLEARMLANPGHWHKHYCGSDHELELARKYSLSDRIRYYWAEPEVQQALDRLVQNLAGGRIPLSLLSQYLPQQYARVRAGTLANCPQELMLDRVADVLEDYRAACSADSQKH